MDFLSRLMRLCRADLHGFMDRFEDSQLLLKQTIREMEESVDRKEARLAEIDTERRKAIGSMESNRSEQRRLARDIDLALEKGKEEIARMLMRNRLVLAESLRRFRVETQQMEQDAGRLADTIRHQRLRLEQVKLRVHEAGRHRYSPVFEKGSGSGPENGSGTVPSDEEVELALMQWKTYPENGGEIHAETR